MSHNNGVQLAGLTKRFGSLTAVDAIDLAIERGETLALLGPNGAGKSTTMLLMAGVLAPDGGSILVAGGAPRHASTRRRVGFAPQALSLYPELSAEENLRFFGRLYGLRGARLRERVERSLELAGLGERRRDRVGVFSGGMKRRLNLACAVVHDPEVILLDEPTVGVDPQSRHHIFQSLEALGREGKTLVYSTHYMEEVQRLCDRAAIMDRGRVLAVDSVTNLIARHGGEAQVEAELTRPPPSGTLVPGLGDDLALRTAHPQPLELVNQLATAGVALKSLRIRQPDLESVFLSLTGRALRD